MFPPLPSIEPLLRLGCFVAVLAAMALWEALAPRRPLSSGRRVRWPSNLGAAFLGTLLVRIVFPASAVGWALLGEQRGWGILRAVDLPEWARIVLSVVLLDLAIYFQHVLFHAVPALWRLHRMHHADLDFDVTTGIRFHPFEIVLSMGIKWLAIASLGTPASSVLIFEIVLNATSLFNHGNVRLPRRLDRVLRWGVVTPDMHRVHHSVQPQETNSNFGFNAPWWDRLFGTYRDQPAAGHAAMTIGIERYRAPRDLWLDRMLRMPWGGAPGPYPISSARDRS